MMYLGRVILVSLLSMQLLLSPFAFAQEQPVLAQEDRVTCIMPWEQYEVFVNYKLAYPVALADNDYVAAQQLFEQMQDVLVTTCQTSASMVDVVTEELDESCQDILTNMLAKNRFYVVGQSDTDNISATQQVIQDILLAKSCSSVLAGDRQETIQLVKADISQNQTIDLENQVVPYAANNCFAAYGSPNQFFIEQVNSVSAENSSVLDTLYNTITTYIGGLDSTIPDETAQYQRKSNLLTFAEKVVQDKRLTWLFGTDNNANNFDDRLGVALTVTNDVLNTQGLNDFVSIFEQQLPLLVEQYVPGIKNHVLWDSYTNTQAILDDVSVTPHTLAWNTDTQIFDEVAAEKGLSIVIPATQEGEEDITLRALVLDAVVMPEEIQETKPGEPTPVTTNEEVHPLKIIADLHIGDEKIMAIEATLQYNSETDDNDIIDVALYIKDYIITNHVVNITDPITGEKTIDMQINVYGLATCDTVIYYTTHEIPVSVEVLPGEFKTIMQTNSEISVSVGKLTATAVVTDTTKMFDDITARRLVVPTSTSAPTTINHVIEAKVFYDSNYIADIFPQDDTWLIKFYEENFTNTKYLFADYIDILLASNPLSMDAVYNIIDLIESIVDRQSLPLDRLGCTDVSAKNYSAKARQDNGTCLYRDEGYGSGNENTGSGTGGDEGYGSGNENSGSGTGGDEGYGSGNENSGTGDDEGGSGYQEIPGCTNPTATNYTTGANFDDGSCTLPPSGPIIGCPDSEYATNYTTGADETIDSNRDLCIYQ